MSRRQDLLDRLSAADPLPDAERLTSDEQHDADALLARLLATPVAPERRPTGARVRRAALVAAATACAALVAFASVNLLDSDAPGPDVVELAVAAVSDDDAVYHVVERKRGRTSQRGQDQSLTFYVESWHTTGGNLHWKLFAARDGRRGRLLDDFAGRRTPGRRGGAALAWDARSNTIQTMRFGASGRWYGAPALDPFADPGAGLRALEAQGQLRLAGSEEVDGRRAYRLTSGYVEAFGRGAEERVDFLVDAETYLPLASHFTRRFGDGRIDVFTRYLVYERLPLNARSRAQLDLDPHPGAKCSPGADKIMGSGSLGFPNPCAR